MLTIYCIPGLGVDKRIFARLDLGHYPMSYVHWITPLKDERLEEYALRLAEQIDASKPFVLIGVSFGGMCSASLTPVLKPLKTILISSSKCRTEVPVKFRLMRYFPLYHLLPAVMFIRIGFWMRKYFGIRSIKGARLFRDMMEKAPKNYYRRAADCVIRWDASGYDPRIIHIHGTRDRVIPFSCVKPTHVIKGGSHMMVLDKAEEISEIIREELKKLEEEWRFGAEEKDHFPIST